MKIMFLSILVAFAFAESAIAVPAKQNYKLTIRGSDEAAFIPKPSNKTPIELKEKYDVVVVGGGLGGLSSALYLADGGKKVLLLEKEAEFGGLAFGNNVETGARYGRGASYWTEAYEEEFKIIERVGMKNYKTEFAIHEPIDSYLWNGKLYLGVWEEETLKWLPSSFAVFKHELQKASEEGLIPNQPIEETELLQLDALSAADWIKSMPLSLAARRDEEAKHIYRRFVEDTSIDPKNPMKDVIDFLTLYCRSALGTNPELISAIGFANFYISEIETRYTSDLGTGVAAVKFVEELKKKSDLVTLKASSTVTGMINEKDGVSVVYVNAGKQFMVKAPFAVYAAPLKFAQWIIKDFEKMDAERAKIIKEMKYSHYNVHNTRVKGHPFRATYDTWTRAENYTENDFTDLILGRWMDPKIKGYEGMRDFSKNPDDDLGVLSIYQPLPLDRVGKGYTLAQVEKDARSSVSRMLEIYSPLLQEKYKQKIDILSVETNRWPYSIHVATPGHFLRFAKVLRKPLGRILFANNNIGTPTFEEALFRGHCTANNILLKTKPGFQQESWTKCPVEKFAE